ncbi:hypothetical protein ASG01_04810 [Chryseobacterium sp. Leaf180]|uniref:hypothetical protein n=1 Tax=Chryseobacterium sp. Leaf180 TaxID=1736289 RepID=UPI0006FB25EB|nr:hypothetical protein [Chryseobacterium sp. Leaf180]KQR95176.1 hypothetical protein ASG01_04810 [Chryseobacterium sp. Leaf180]
MINESQDNNDIAEHFFEENPPQPISTDDRVSEQESFLLFGGDMNNIDVFIKHEEFKLKFFEFKHREKTQNGEAESILKDRENERSLRKENAKKAFYFSSTWAVFIGIIILIHGWQKHLGFDISENEFMFICGTLTASVLIFYLTVIKNLFPNKPDINSSESKSEK